MKKKLLTSVLATTYVACLFGQSTSPTVPTLPDITFKSPKAASMQKFGDYPVSLFTGLVDITVPVYEIDINGIKVPIEFKYHASGIKYDDTSLELGLGWSFMAGGLISHQVRGDDRITSGIPAPGSPEVKRMEDIDPRGLGSTNIDSGYRQRYGGFWKLFPHVLFDMADRRGNGYGSICIAHSAGKRSLS